MKVWIYCAKTSQYGKENYHKNMWQLLTFVTILINVSYIQAANRAPVITTSHGKIQGIKQNAVKAKAGSEISKGYILIETEAFLGIPYAKPPLGNLRFAPPENANSWSTVKIADRYGYGCPMVPDEVFKKSGTNFQDADMWNTKLMGEDCLNLNIWRPANTRKNNKLPIAVWIYGGAFSSGANSLDVYDGRVLAGTGRVIVISINYRLGALGFIPPVAGTSSVGNVGLLDQRLALRWIYENAGNLGGDRSKITIIGESAGSVSVGIQILNKHIKEPLVDRRSSNDIPPDVPYTHTYFQNAIQQSGTPNTGWAYIYKEEAYKRLALLAKATDCYVIGSISSSSFSIDQQSATFENIINCLRGKSATEIVNAQFVTAGKTWLFPFVPVVGAPMLRHAPNVLLKMFLNERAEETLPTNVRVCKKIHYSMPKLFV